MGNEYFLLNASNAINYAKNKLQNLFSQNEYLDCEEIGDGNINYVFRIKNKDKSVILKQGADHLRQSGRALDKVRTKIEAESLKRIWDMSQKAPKIYFYDDVMNIIAMEDISGYENLRYALMDGKVYPNLAKEVVEYFGKNYLPTTSLVMDRAKRKKDMAKFINVEMCDITEDLVMTEPYYNYKNRNIIYNGNQDYVEKNLYNNKMVLYEAAVMREKFMNYPQALIHGDLHTGSMFINDSGIKVIDSEFAFYGPVGYDLGCLIGNLLIEYHYHKMKKNNKMKDYLYSTVAEILSGVGKKIYSEFENLPIIPMYTGQFKIEYAYTILIDGIKYAGMEMIRRSIGDSKVIELTGLEDDENKRKFQKKLVKEGVALLVDCDVILDEFLILGGENSKPFN